MPRKRHSPEQIIRKLREAEVELGGRSRGGRRVQEAGHRRANILSLAQSVRRPEGRRHEAPPGPGEGEWPAQEGGGRSDPRQADPAGGPPGKLLSPARKRQTTKRVQQLLNVSERRACTAMGWVRSSQRHVLRTGEPATGARLPEQLRFARCSWSVPKKRSRFHDRVRMYVRRQWGRAYVFPEGRKQVPVLLVTWSYSNCPFAITVETVRSETILHGSGVRCSRLHPGRAPEFGPPFELKECYAR